MLIYFAQGRRDYRRDPLRPHTRQGWEFQAVLSGRIRPTFGATRAGAPGGFSRRRLWAFAPGCEHGWDGDGRSSRIAVWHFGGVNPSLDRWVGAAGVADVSLDADDVRVLSALASQTARHYPRPTNFTGPVSDRVRAELTLMAMRAAPVRTSAGPAEDPGQHAAQTVARAMAWFAEHMTDGPGVAEVAGAVAVSEAHLRRLFRAAAQGSPQEVLAAMRADRAEHLLRTTDWKLAVVAEAVGFSGPQAFSRAYRAAKGCSPGETRRR
ncbi:MAG: AraC family transcriptional regulator [Planctomycetota bacterium]